MVLLVAILARVVLSWIPSMANSPVYTVIHEVTEPILAPIRQILPRIGMLDLSPMVATFILIIILRASIALNN